MREMKGYCGGIERRPFGDGGGGVLVHCRDGSSLISHNIGVCVCGETREGLSGKAGFVIFFFFNFINGHLNWTWMEGPDRMAGEALEGSCGRKSGFKKFHP